MKKRLFDVGEISEYLGVTASAVYCWVSKRKIPYVKIGGRTKFDLGQIDAWILENSVAVGEESREGRKKKACSRCGEPKALGKFTMDKRRKDGHVNGCKMCLAKKAKERWKEKKAKREAHRMVMDAKKAMEKGKEDRVFKGGERLDRGETREERRTEGRN